MTIFRRGNAIYLASLGVILTAVYIYGLIFRPKRRFLDLGIDSFVLLALYVVGVVGLFSIVRGKNNGEGTSSLISSRLR